jgi:hypothetical protein
LGIFAKKIIACLNQPNAHNASRLMDILPERL